jgi:UDP-N-acetylglucosamine:LPS N-acetylglucosamine transferase
MKVLLLPLFQFPTGHLKVADTIEEHVQKQYPDADIKVVDFLNYCSDKLEKLVSGIYLKGFLGAPFLYRALYYTIMYKQHPFKMQPDLQVLSYYFERKMQKFLEEEKPDLVFCTHSFPSGIISSLKQKGRYKNITAVNVYTDFFINDIWGKQGIDYHFVPHHEAKEELTRKHHLSGENIFVTGIPVSTTYQFPSPHKAEQIRHVLVAGGNSGLVNSFDLIGAMQKLPHIQFGILCGNNEELFAELQKLDSEQIIPIGYIHDPDELNKLYDEADAIMTKPGGVTISEALQKRLPILIHTSLPGQEEINMDFLLEKKLAIVINNDQMIKQLKDEAAILALRKNIDAYLKEITCPLETAIHTAIKNTGRKSAEPVHSLKAIPTVYH